MRLGAVLYVYKGEHGLPSIDFECMRALCLVKFPRAPVRIETDTNPFYSGVGKLPYLRVGNEKFVGYRQIKQFLDDESYPVDKHLTGEARLLSEAYSQWIFNQLHAYYHYFMYCEPKNVEETRRLYAKRTPFPFSFYYPGTYGREAQDIVLTMAGIDVHEKVSDDDIENLVLRAKIAVNAISQILNKRIWFFGEYFSEVDATIYSYLALLYRIKLEHNPLENHIKGCKNLVSYINRISRDIFRQESFSTLKTTKYSSSDGMLTETERQFLESEKKTKIVAGVGAVAAMGAFAVWRGIFKQLTSSRTEYGYGFEDDDGDDEDDDPEL